LGAALVGRLSYVQIFHHGFYKALAQGQQSSPYIAKGERGNIFSSDKQGNLHTLSTNHKVSLVFATPSEVTNPKEAARALANILNLQESFILEKLSHTTSLFEVLKRKLSQEEEDALGKASLPGLYLKQESIRQYPLERLASQVLGFVNQDEEGQYGLEEYYQEDLEGKEGFFTTIRNAGGYLALESKEGLKNGADLFLTLDYNIQARAESLLLREQAKLKFEQASIIVMDPTSGRILALSNTPSFNPNEYEKVQDLAVFQNPTIQSLFEPGSVFKPLTMAGAIDAGALKPETTYQDKGIVRIGGYKVLNYDERIWGQRTMTEVLEFSINTGAVFAQQQLGNEKFLQVLERFGMFEPTGVDLAGEAYSFNQELKKGYDINFVTASFGQGIEITPIQLMRAYSALANKGIMVKPYLVEKRMGSKEQKTQPEFSLPVVSPKTASQVTQMMVNVIENGFSKRAKIPGYYLAGKTGTAQVAWSALGVNKSGYSDKTVQSFMGFGPAYDPKFMILVKLNNPQTKTAEYSAMPLFRELAKYIIDYLEIPPDYEVE
jgi:cell division protein FtsI (penicillin-binding protein 3)/stage V sporulation protein D (sporulation-specific penicillin-binding protein)